MPEWIAQNYVVITIVCAVTLLGAVTGALGVFTVLRKQALVGDALSHAALPGVVLAFMFTGSRDMHILLMGAALSAAIAMALMTAIKRFSKIKNDGALALILSSFFGIGQLMLKAVQNRGSSASAGLSSFIFGQAATVLQSDVYLIGAVSSAAIICLAVFWKELKLYIFDSGYFQSLGFSRRIAEGLLTVLTVIVVVISIRAVGVILMSALLISPGVAARQWSNKLSVNVILSSAFGVICASAGTLISASRTNLPTGPVITVMLSIILILSIAFSPKKGVVITALRFTKHKKYIKNMSFLASMLHGAVAYNGTARQRFLINAGYISLSNGMLSLTDSGKSAVNTVKEEGL